MLANNGIINDTTLLVGEDGQGRLTDLQGFNVGHSDRLVKLDTILSSDSSLVIENIFESVN